jgi:hypothetical protein
MDEAEPLMRRALEIREKTLVPDHPDTYKSIEVLAGLLETTGRFEEAEPLRQRVLERRDRTLGPEHPDTLRRMNNQSAGLRKQGDFAQAELIDRQVVASTMNIHGAAHPCTIHRRSNLVLDLIFLGKLTEARDLLRESWQSDAERYANTTPRFALQAYLIALLEAHPDTPFLGQLKTLLTGPELPVTGEVALPVEIGYFFEAMREKLPQGSVEFLTALLNATNDSAKVAALDQFAAWRDQPPIPLDAPWPTD